MIIGPGPWNVHWAATGKAVAEVIGVAWMVPWCRPMGVPGPMVDHVCFFQFFFNCLSICYPFYPCKYNFYPFLSFSFLTSDGQNDVLITKLAHFRVQDGAVQRRYG